LLFKLFVTQTLWSLLLDDVLEVIALSAFCA